MDIGASCYSLQCADGGGGGATCTSDETIRRLSLQQDTNWKTYIPQVLAAAIAASFHIVVGFALAYSAILVPQLEQSSGDMHATKSETSWIVSIMVIMVPVGAILAGFVMDAIGRLNTIRLAIIPVMIGWSIIATAQSIAMIFAGRVLTGLGVAWFSSPAVVYITEIAHPDLRGSLVSSAPAYASLGMVLAYLKGWFLSWRTTAWLCNVYVIISSVLIMLIPESPAWLVSKSRLDDARKSLEWINRYQQSNKTISQAHLDILIKEKQEQENPKNSHGTLKLLFSSVALKPMIILAGLFFFQNFSGIYVTLFYSVTLFVEMGATVNPYLASVLIGLVRFIMSMVNTVLLKKYRRRPLVMISSAGMCICTCVSGLYTYWIKQGTTSQTWIPVLFLLLYVLTSMIGMLPIPWTMTAELFPLEIRGVAHSISYSLANILMFASLQSYRPLDDILGGAAGVQWFFATIAFLSIGYTWVFLPETHGKKLHEIQDYFRTHTVYIGCRKHSKDSFRTMDSLKEIIETDVESVQPFLKSSKQ